MGAANFANLPSDLVRHIAGFLETSSVLALSATCRRIHDVIGARNDLFWSHRDVQRHRAILGEMARPHNVRFSGRLALPGSGRLLHTGGRNDGVDRDAPIHAAVRFADNERMARCATGTWHRLETPSFLPREGHALTRVVLPCGADVLVLFGGFCPDPAMWWTPTPGTAGGFAAGIPDEDTAACAQTRTGQNEAGKEAKNIPIAAADGSEFLEPTLQWRRVHGLSQPLLQVSAILYGHCLTVVGPGELVLTGGLTLPGYRGASSRVLFISLALDSGNHRPRDASKKNVNGDRLVLRAREEPWGDGRPRMTPRGYHSATLLPGTRQLLVFGGMSGHGNLAKPEILDLDTGTWSDAIDTDLILGELPAARFGHSMTPLPEGPVVLIGGGVGTDLLRDGEDCNDAAVLLPVVPGEPGQRQRQRQGRLPGAPQRPRQWAWKRLRITGDPLWDETMGREHSASLVGNTILLFGGSKAGSDHVQGIRIDNLRDPAVLSAILADPGETRAADLLTASWSNITINLLWDEGDDYWEEGEPEVDGRGGAVVGTGADEQDENLTAQRIEGGRGDAIDPNPDEEDEQGAVDDDDDDDDDGDGDDYWERHGPDAVHSHRAVGVPGGILVVGGFVGHGGHSNSECWVLDLLPDRGSYWGVEKICAPQSQAPSAQALIAFIL
jgi:hypothetical protein